MKNYRILKCLFGLFYWLCCSDHSTYALSFQIPDPNTQIVGDLEWVQTIPNDNFNTLSRRYGVGYYEIMEANPGIDSMHLEPGTIIVLPTRFILPPGPRKGLVINLAELRLYSYAADKVYTYPIGIGREAWDTPLGYSRVIAKLKNPTWHVPRSIQEASRKDGIIIPSKVLPGPDNPLGPYALRLHYHNYLIHGTNEVEGVGRRSTAGCIRMFPEDIKVLFEQVSIGTSVNIIDQPYKAGKDHNGLLYLEAHLPLELKDPDSQEVLKTVKRIILAQNSEKRKIDENSVKKIITQTLGIPQKIEVSKSL